MKLPSMAIDLGSANTRMYQLGTGVVLEEPSYIALDGDRRSVRSVGQEAKSLIGRTVDGTTVRAPIFEGNVNDEGAAALMLDIFLNKVTLKRLGKTFARAVFRAVRCGKRDD